IPYYGAIGAAIACSAAQVAGSIPVAIYAARAIGGVTLHVYALVRAIAAATVAGGVALGVVWAVPVLFEFPAGLLAYAITFALASMILRPLTAEDGSWIDATAGGWAHGLVGLTCRHLAGRALPSTSA